MRAAPTIVQINRNRRARAAAFYLALRLCDRLFWSTFRRREGMSAARGDDRERASCTLCADVRARREPQASLQDYCRHANSTELRETSFDKKTAWQLIATEQRGCLFSARSDGHGQSRNWPEFARSIDCRTTLDCYRSRGTIRRLIGDDMPARRAVVVRAGRRARCSRLAPSQCRPGRRQCRRAGVKRPQSVSGLAGGKASNRVLQPAA